QDGVENQGLAAGQDEMKAEDQGVGPVQERQPLYREQQQEPGGRGGEQDHGPYQAAVGEAHGGDLGDEQDEQGGTQRGGIELAAHDVLRDERDGQEEARHPDVIKGMFADDR